MTVRAHAPALDTTAAIKTPEHVRFDYRLAGPAKRATAWVVDSLIKIGILIVLAVLANSAGFVMGGPTGGAVLVVAFGLEWGYHVLFETLWSGRTPGKRAVQVRVVKEGGYAIGFGDAVIRNLLRAADYLPSLYSLGLFVCAVDPRFRRLGDLAAGTMVVVEERTRVQSALNISPPPSSQELRGVPVRPRFSGAELEGLELYLRRVGTLSPAREVELADMVAPIYAARFGGLRYASSARFLALLYHQATRR